MSNNKILKKYMLMIIFSILMVNTSNSISNNDGLDNQTIVNNIEHFSQEMAKRDSITAAEAIHVAKQFEKSNVNKLTTSSNGKDFIKSHEGYKDIGYKLGDGMVTIGYGHAEKIGTSKYDVGSEITPNEAQGLFDQDVLEAENGVKRMLIRMIDNNDRTISINQNMFDALVSMAFNMGVSGLANSEFIESLANSTNPIETAKMIKTTKIGGWSGLKKRRQGEYELFTSGNNKSRIK